VGLTKSIINVDLRLEVKGCRVGRIKGGAGRQYGCTGIQRGTDSDLRCCLGLGREVGEGDVCNITCGLPRYRINSKALNNIALCINQVEALIEDESTGTGLVGLACGRVA